MQTLDLINISYKKDSRIREVKFKDKFETKSFNEIEKMDCFNKKHLDSMMLGHEYICEESFTDFENRIKEFIDELPKDKNILICSHAGALKMLNSLLQDIDYDKNHTQFNYSESIIL
jgi:broad specificity phosphatase PhoE